MMSTMKLISSHIVQLHGAYAAVRNMFTIAKTVHHHQIVKHLVVL